MSYSRCPFAGEIITHSGTDKVEVALFQEKKISQHTTQCDSLVVKMSSP